MTRKTAMSTYASTIEGAVSDAMSALEELGSEVREVFDNMPESLQSGNRGDMLNAAADELEYLSAPDVPECISGIPISFEYKPNRRPSRSDRRYEAVRMLEHARDAAQDWLDDDSNAETDAEVSEGERDINSEREEVEQFISDIEEVINSAENVEFPGMYS
jgi:hypothetical protein